MTISEKDSTEGNDRPGNNALSVPSQTPLFHATQAARYSRQDTIRAIQEATGRKLICYVSGPAGYIERDDVLALTDLLQKTKQGVKLDFMLHTLGGDIDAAEKIAGLLLRTVGPEGELRVIVPDCAKSAGTLISLAARSIVMSDTSELGPIDPQIVTTASDGSQSTHPAQSYIDSYNDMMALIEKGVSGPAVDALVAKFDPVHLDVCRKACARSRKFAETFLRTGMHRNATVNFTEIASKLDSNKTWLSHGAVIDAYAAKEIGLNIDYRDGHENEWQYYWRLYLQMRLALNNNTEKLFESDYASLQI